MSEHVQSLSITWAAINAVSGTGRTVGPVLLLLGTAIWWLRARSIWPAIASVGAALMLWADVTHRVVLSVSSISVGTEQPTVQQGWITYFAFLHAHHIGLLLLAVALIAAAGREVRRGDGSSRVRRPE